jgi:hypothetical protein
MDRVVVGPDRDALTDELLRVPASYGLEVQKPGVVDVRDDHAELVAVAVEKKAWLAAGVHRSEHVTVHVSADIVGERLGERAYDLLHRLLVAGDTGRGQQRTEEFLR